LCFQSILQAVLKRSINWCFCIFDYPSRVGSLARNAQVDILEKRGSWYKVKRSSTVGYVHGDYIKLESGDTSKPDNGSVIGTGKVTASSLNVRSGPSTGSSRIGSLARNAQVDILEKQGSWYKVKRGSTVGYVHGDYLNVSNGQESSRDSVVNQGGIVTASALNVRKGPSTSYSRITLLYKNTQVVVLEKTKGWYKIQRGSTTGYVDASYIKLR
jgi:uncharacterized protein YgiM (DUF1202 family)